MKDVSSDQAVALLHLVRADHLAVQDRALQIGRQLAYRIEGSDLQYVEISLASGDAVKAVAVWEEAWSGRRGEPLEDVPRLLREGAAEFNARRFWHAHEAWESAWHALRARRLLFAVDQQPYLQGYLPIVLLAERARHQLFPARGELIPTGPDFLTPALAANVIELSRRGYR